MSIGANKPIRNMFLDDSRIMATGSLAVQPREQSLLFAHQAQRVDHVLGVLVTRSWVRVLARSMGLVPMTARPLATPASDSFGRRWGDSVSARRSGRLEKSRRVG